MRSGFDPDFVILEIRDWDPTSQTWIRTVIFGIRNGLSCSQYKKWAWVVDLSFHYAVFYALQEVSLNDMVIEIERDPASCIISETWSRIYRLQILFGSAWQTDLTLVMKGGK